MRPKMGWLVPLVALLAGGSPPDAAKPENDLVVHEWGTFLGMSGSNGVALDGMYHEEHALPAFVHARGRDQLRPISIFTKGETPVIYFYTGHKQNVSVEVKFPRGVWTQWYPQSRFVLPRLASLPVPATDGPRDGRIVWGATLVPAAMTPILPPPPPTSADALWNYARDVDAAFVQAYNPLLSPPNHESERFLFYRGLGTAPLPLRMSAESGGTLAADAPGPGAKHVFILRIEGGRAAYTYRPALAPGESVRGIIPSLRDSRPVAEVAGAIADDLARRLVASGLYPKEARAMVNTWRSSYFGTEGVRALFVLPQSWTDEFIPLAITPTPKSVTRVMVGRLELLTPAREQLAEAAVRDLASPEPSKRLTALKILEAQGRYAEPIVRRVLQTTGDESVRVLCRRLLLAGFVTDLRSVLKSPAATQPLEPAMMLNEEPVYIRARLSALLREVGLDSEAKVEGRAALAELAKRTPLPLTHCDARYDLKAFALATEAIGDDRGAADRYGRLVDLAAVAVRTNDCRQCHVKNSTDIADRLGEWWAGEAYARTEARSGGLDVAIAATEATLNLPLNRDSARLRLAYLYQAKGRRVDADALWSIIRASRDPVAMKP